MSAPRDHAARRSGERGAVLVIFAVFMSVAVLLTAFVVDVGNWFEHQRHLQVQADAAAFAAAAKFNYPCTPEVEKSIYQAAGQYGGAETVLAPAGKKETTEAPLLNAQIGGTTQANIHEEINSRKYFGQSSGDTTTVEKAPCEPEASMIDVKMTETNLPWFFKFAHVPNVNAHARVSIVQQRFATAVEPLVESEPEEVRVLFVNDEPDGSDSQYEDELLGTGLLTNIGSNEEKGTIKWTDSSAPVSLAIAKHRHIGVRIALAGKKGALTGAGNEGVAVCRHEYVECFDEDTGVVPPLLNISGYSAEGEGTASPLAPVAHKVSLSTPSPDTCTDPYFNAYPGSEPKAQCTITISAEVQYGKESSNTTGVTVAPELVYTEGFSNKTEKVKQPAMKLENGVWTGTANLPSYFYGNFGSSEINLVVKCKPEAKSPCEKATKTEEKTLADVQRAFSAGPDGSNRIIAAKVFEPGAATPVPGETGANAFEICEKADSESCTHKLAVTIELKGSLEDAKKFCGAEKYANGQCKPIPPFRVTYADNDQEDDDQFVLSCPPTTVQTGAATAYQEALAHGCAGKYSVNTHGGSCTVEKESLTKIEAEEKTELEARTKEETTRKGRETTEAAERTKWATEEGEAKLTKAQRETKENTAETKALWERQEGEGKITKAAREAKEVTKGQLEKEEKEGKLTKAAREAKEKTAETKALWERQEARAEITKVAREAKEVTKGQLEKEEKELKLTKAQRETKEKEQTTAREKAEKEEATARTKREGEEAATKAAREKQGGSAHECLGLVSVQPTSKKEHPGGELNEGELTASFQNYLAKRVEGAANGTHYYCPDKWVNNNEGAVPVIPSNDSRLMQFFVVPFTVTDFQRKNEVSPLVPIRNFATFYVTGWDAGNTEAAQGKKAWNPKERRDGCSEKLFKKLPAAEQTELENEAIPLKQREQKEKEKGFDDDTEQPREIVGHLIKYVNVLAEASGTVECKLEGLETCEASLTE